MKKRISSYVILSGLLSCSVVLFGMDSQQSSHPSQEAQKNQLSQGHHHHHHHHLKDIEKKVISDLEKVEDVLHPIVQKGIEELKQEPQVIAAVLNTIGVKQQDAQNITNAIEKGADIAAKIDDSVYNLTQKLEEVQIAKNADQKVVDAVKK